jgi:hypothetical protein
MYSYRHGSCTPGLTVLYIPALPTRTTSRIMHSYNGKTTHQGKMPIPLISPLAVVHPYWPPGMAW